MNILVCIKQVPAGSVPMDSTNGTIDRKKSGGRINPWDLYALNAALAIKDKIGGTVTAFTMGPERASEVLVTALATGADEAILLSDRAFAGADVYATAFTIGEGIKVSGQYDLIICGQQTTDGDTAQLPFSLAVRMGVPGIGWVKKIEKVDKDSITLLQELSIGTQKVEIKVPCLIAVGEGMGKPGIPSLMDQLKAKKKEIKKITLKELEIKDPNKYGLKASPTQVIKIHETEHTRKASPLYPEGNILNLIKEEISNLPLKNKEANKIERKERSIPKTNNGVLSVWIQLTGNHIHPISKKVIETALKLGREKNLKVEGIVFTEKYNEELEVNLKESGLDEIHVGEAPIFNVFIPENIILFINEKVRKSEIFLVPATPEGRTVSSMVAAKLGTGVTADCTSLTFNEEGLLVQTRPAFSGNVMASIVTKEKRPEMASLRYGQKEPQIKGEGKISKTRIKSFLPYKAEIVESLEENGKSGNIIFAVGNGIREKEDLVYFKKISDLLGAEFCSSRALIDKGFMLKKSQIGLSGRSVSPNVLITVGISGSLQFLAGLESPGKIIAINNDPNAPIMKIADVPIVSDMYSLINEI